ncbi:MAG: 5'-nucleotidase C-terminal domain-containing protein, partial [Microbacterium sp.]|nr:5'-nucleotidase C-terminal domain-containing protein [Microbacterium sp.]
LDGSEGNGEADLVIALVHDGAALGVTDGVTFEDELAAGGTFAELVTETDPRVAAIFTGHTHKQYAWDAPIFVDGVATAATRPIVQTGSYGEYLGHVRFELDPVTLEVEAAHAENIARVGGDPAPFIAEFPRVAAVDEIVQDALEESAVIGEQPIGQITADITTAFVGSTRDDRSSESALGNLVANALRDTLADPLKGGAEIGVTNPGGLRSELLYARSGSETADGIVTYAEANAVLPFANNLSTVTLTGAQLDQLLEQQWQPDLVGGGRPARPYLALGLSDNVTWVGDTAATTAQPGDHVKAIYIDGVLVQPSDEIRVGTLSFLAAGGDNFTVLTQGSNPLDAGIVDRDAWVTYLQSHQPLSPSFARSRAQIPALPSGTLTPDVSTLFFQAQGLNLTSLGAPANTSATLKVDGVSVGGSFPVSNGSVTVSTVVPSSVGSGQLTAELTVQPSGTVVRVPVTVDPIQDLTAGAPAVTGTLRVGQLLTADPGAWSPAPVAFSYRWYTVGTDLVTRTLVQQGASASYTPTAADAGKYVYVVVDASKPGYHSASAQSGWRGFVATAALTVGAPVVSGALRVDGQLIADAGVWGPAPVDFSYRWYTVAQDLVTRTLVQDSASAAYTLTASDVGKYVYVVVVGSKAGYSSASAQSAWRGYVAAATLTVGTPVVSGALKVGTPLTADPGAWSPAPVAFSYRWYTVGQDLVTRTLVQQGASASYTPTAADAGKYVYVVVDATKDGYASTAAQSPWRGYVLP